MSNVASAPQLAGANPKAYAHPRRHRVRRWIAGVWQLVLQFALVLWVVRVPLTMTAIGFLLLGMAPQAQDLFLEFARPSEWPPAVLTTEHPSLLVEIARWQIWRILLFVVILTFVWAMPTHYAARLLLDTDVRFRALLAAQPDGRPAFLPFMNRCVPRVLGLATFVAVLVGIARSHANIPIIDEKEIHRTLDLWLTILTVAVLIGAAGFYGYMKWRPREAEVPVLREIKRLNRWLAPLWRALAPGLRPAPGSPDEASQDVGRFLFAAVFVAFVCIFFLGADRVAWLFPRAMAIPFILGGWMPLLGYLSGLGRQWRAPLIVGLFSAISLASWWVGNGHSVRRVEAASAGAADTSRISLEVAADLWIHENCDDKVANCPRPIVVTSSGGASRAGFYMASVIGRLMLKAKENGLSENDLRKRLFAISSVSGSSVGAVMVTAALDARTDAATSQACEKRAVPQWWGITVNNWQDCFQALTSGDFLTAVFFGFAFNDVLPFAVRDRAAVLEDAWSARFNELVTRNDSAGDHPNCAGLECPFLTLRPRRGHWIPLLVLNGTSEATGGRIVTTLLKPDYEVGTHTCPILAGPNGCKLFSETDYFHDLIDSEPDKRLASWTGDIERRVLRWWYRGKKLDDVRLSTAAHNSARFPFISPPGSVRNKGQQVVDRIVDGGYFENYGAISASELALALHALHPELVPLVIVISNDPDDVLDPSTDSDPLSTDAASEQAAQQSIARARVSGSEFVTDLTGPIKSFAHAWPAHGTLAVEDLRAWLHQTNANCQIQLVHVRVWPQTEKANETSSRAVSMSWWLSAPVQRHLHQQTEDGKNGNKNEPRLKAIWDAMKPGNCATEPPQAG